MIRPDLREPGFELLQNLLNSDGLPAGPGMIFAVTDRDYSFNGQTPVDMVDIIGEGGIGKSALEAQWMRFIKLYMAASSNPLPIREGHEKVGRKINLSRRLRKGLSFNFFHLITLLLVPGHNSDCISPNGIIQIGKQFLIIF